MIFRVGFFLVFFSFLARNDLKFLVFGEKSKCEKNATHNEYPRKIFESSAKIFESSNFLAESSAILD